MTTTTNEGKKNYVLVADDDPAILWLVRTLVEGEGYSVVTAMDGKDALRMLKSDRRVIAAIVDVMMPYIQGTELVKFMQSDEKLKKIPVIMMTAEQNPKLPSKSFQSGAIAFLPKPFTNAQLRTILRTVALKP
ncbi:MAG TPA: response regulator [Pyrinomonadaceae bacterium]|nr:response regulator [Pyrinomonadaceae bacterium]